METNHENQTNLSTDQAKTIDEVFLSIMEWNDLRNDAVAMSDVLGDGNMFYFTIPLDATSPYVHAYPGIINGNLVYQLITSENDKAINFQLNVHPTTVRTCPVETKQMPGVGGTIPQLEAMTRVGNWNNTLTRESWIGTETTNETMFQAFIIPVDDIVSNQKHAAYFALKAGPESDFIADLIIINTQTNELMTIPATEVEVDGGLETTTYYDMVRPVPPYKAGLGREKANFGLLNFVEAQQ